MVVIWGDESLGPYPPRVERNNGLEHGSYYSIRGLYGDNGKENGNLNSNILGSKA